MISFLADENLKRKIISGLLRRNPSVDVVRAQDIGLSGADDRILGGLNAFYLLLDSPETYGLPTEVQATVPLIDFDLSGTESTLTGRRTETQAGTPLASQMATKLDLARGYIDLGVKDGARELLEEVMRDGTREQRQQAVELIKMVEA